MIFKSAIIAILLTILAGGASPLAANQTNSNGKQTRSRKSVSRKPRATRRTPPPAKNPTPVQSETPSLEQADGTTISIVGEPFKGNGRARVVLIEFSDFECSYCGRYFADAYAQIDAAYIKTGKIKYVFRDFPLERIHPNAFTAAEAANCANEQGKFWAMHDRLYANQQSLAESDLSTHAQAVGLNAARFDACLTTDKYAAEIRRDMAEGAAVGITGTPAFLIALAVPNNPKVKIIKTLSGSLPFDDFKAAIDEALGMKR